MDLWKPETVNIGIRLTETAETDLIRRCESQNNPEKEDEILKRKVQLYQNACGENAILPRMLLEKEDLQVLKANEILIECTCRASQDHLMLKA